MGANPFSAVKKNGSVIQHAESERARKEQEIAREEAQKAEQVITDKVANLLRSPVFVTDYTWPSLYVTNPAGGMKQLFVSQFFPDKMVAVDKFYSYDDVAKWEVDAKREKLEKIGVKYAALFPDTKLSDLAAMVGA